MRNIEQFKKMVNDCRVAMFGSYKESDLEFRPMSHADVDNAGNIWFYTTQDATKVEEIAKNNNVLLTYSHDGNNTYMSITGTASISNDRDKMKELMNPFVKAWFPDGVDDPTMRLIVVDPEEVNYWVNNNNKVISYIKMLSAAVLGTKPNVGEHGKITL